MGRLMPRGLVYLLQETADAALVAAFSSNVVDKWRFLVVYYHC